MKIQCARLEMWCAIAPNFRVRLGEGRPPKTTHYVAEETLHENKSRAITLAVLHDWECQDGPMEGEHAERPPVFEPWLLEGEWQDYRRRVWRKLHKLGWRVVRIGLAPL